MPALAGGITFEVEGDLTTMLAGNAQVKANASGTLTGGITAGAQGRIGLPLFGVRGVAAIDAPLAPAQGRIGIPLFGVRGSGGGSGRVGVPLFGVRGSADIAPILSGRVGIPLFGVRGSADIAPILSGRVGIPLFGVRGSGGAQGRIGLPLFGVRGSAEVLPILRGRIGLPLFGVRGSAEVLPILRGRIGLPLFGVRGTGGAQGRVGIPAFGLSARLAISPAAGDSWETTYAVNVSTGAVTRWTLGAADKLVTAHGALYVLRDGSLYRVDAPDDLGLPIRAYARLAANPLGANQVKRATDIYLSARQMDGVIVELIADETQAWRYFKPPAIEAGYATHKLNVGEGVHFYTAGLTLRNRNGGAFEVGGLELLVKPLSKRPR